MNSDLKSKSKSLNEILQNYKSTLREIFKLRSKYSGAVDEIFVNNLNKDKEDTRDIDKYILS